MLSGNLQFLLKSTDADVKKYLQMLTFVPLEDIEAIMSEHEVRQTPGSAFRAWIDLCYLQNKPDQRAAQKLLASEVTELVHGCKFHFFLSIEK